MTGRLESLVIANPVKTRRPVAWTIMGFLALFLIWANFARLDEFSVAQGEVVPAGGIKTVQHLEGGIIREIYVKDGDTVTNGTPLVQLDLAITATNRDELLVRIDGFALARARLHAEINGTPLAFPEEEAKRRPDFVRAERENFDARKRELQSTLNVLGEQARQRQLEVQELESKRRTASNNLRLARQKLAMSKDLLKEGLTAKMEHIATEREVESLEGEVAALDSQVPRARAAASEINERLHEERNKFSRSAQEQLTQAENNIARHKELLNEATEQRQRTAIASPIDGVVKNMRYHTIGGVVKPGEPIMEIVPTREKLVIEAKLNPVDRGYVAAGQDALVKISTYDFARYGGLIGKVTLVAPDSTTPTDGQQPYFRVVAETEKNHLGKEEGSLPITPGMQASVEIHTGTKTVMEYLVKPVLKLRHEAFRER